MAAPGGYKQVGSEEDQEHTTKQFSDSGRQMSATLRAACREPTPISESDLRKSSGAMQIPARRMQQNSRLGPYQLVCELASGGMATVYLALYRSIEGFEKLCAVKRIHPHLANDRAFADMFIDEARIAARISHPYVCSVFSFGKSQSSHYIAMEFLRGEPLSAVSRKVARAPHVADDPRFPAIAARLMANFAEGLHAAHTLKDDRGVALDIVHRDVTPQNLFVLFDGSVRVTDFGIAHARQRLHHTEGQKLKGKLSYIAPEQLTEGPVDLRVDVWGLGVTLWELLTGRRLFLGSNEGETLAAVSSRAVRPPSELRASVPAELDRIVLRALERDRNKRYRSARDLARDLERFLATCGDPVPAMDVADWMAQLFPQGDERIQALMELAAEVSLSSRDETVLRVPSAPPSSRSPFDGDLRLFPKPVISSQPPIEVESVTLARAPDVAPHSPAHRTSTTLPVARGRLVLEEQSETSVQLPKTKERSPSLALATVPSASGASPLLSASNQKLAVAATGLLVTAAIGVAIVLGRPKPVVAPSVARLAEAAPAAAQPAPAPRAPSTAELDAVNEEPAPAHSTTNAGEAAAAKHGASAAASGLASAPSSEAPSAAEPATSAPLAAPRAVGDVFISTPGGSWEVLDQGRLLGRTPGSFRLSVGEHALVLRGADGSQQSFWVTIVANAPKVVTFKVAQ